MRRIFKTTTAIVASLSLILPQLALAQDNPAPNPQQQQQQLKKKQQQAKQEQAKQQKPAAEKAAPKNAQANKPAPKKDAQNAAPKKPQAEMPAAKKQAPNAANKQQAKQQAPAQQKPAQQKPAQQKPAQQKPANAQAKQQNQQPKPNQSANQQPGKQQPAKQQPAKQPGNNQQAQQPAKQQPAQQPKNQAKSASGQAANGQNNGKKPAQNANAQQKPAVQRVAPVGPNGQQKNAKAPPNADALKKAMQANEKRPGPNAAAPKAAPPAPQQAAQQGGNGGPKLRGPNDNRERAVSIQPPDNGAIAPDTREGLRRALADGKGKAQVAPPEARAKPNDVANRAAQGGNAPAAAALAAAAGSVAKGDIVERKITKDNTRRSDQDFRNSLADSERDLERRERDLDNREDRLDQREDAQRNNDRRDDDRRDHARRDDHDSKNDIAKLLLAGAAGFAVGKMMSNNRQVALNTGDRAVLTLPDGSQQIVRDDNALLYQPGSDVQTENFQDGSSRTTVQRADGSRVVTIRDANMNILRRTLIRPNGTETMLIDDTQVRPVKISSLPAPQPVQYSDRPLDESDLRDALLRESSVDRRFTLGQIRDIPEVRSLVAPVNVPEITFETNSAAVTSTQAEQLATLGKVIREAIDKNPNEIFMIEGYTDAVGSPAANLALSDRRAESVALALTEYYQVPPENMVVQGYGEQFQLIPSNGEERDNRRVDVRRITDLLEQS